MKSKYRPSRLLLGVVFLAAMVELYSLLPPAAPSGGAAATSATPQPVVPYRQGILHVHSVHSGGGGPVAEIASRAREAGMDFVVVTDYASSAARREGSEKAYDGTDVYVEMEAMTPGGHALLFYSHTPSVSFTDEQANELAWKHFLGEGMREGVFIVTAHPSNTKNPWSRLDRFPEGMEAINFDSIWRRMMSDSFASLALVGAIYPFNNFLGAMRFFELYPKDFTAWDGMNEFARKHFAILGHDAHSRVTVNPHVKLRWPDYGTVFRLASNVVFIDEPIPADFEARKRQLYESIRRGRLAMVFHSVHPFSGNDWALKCATRFLRPGEDVSFDKSCDFVVQTPPTLPWGTVLRLIRNGEVAREIPAAPGTTTIPLEGPGAYRLEVWLRARSTLRVLLDRDVPYVFYNPIYVR